VGHPVERHLLRARDLADRRYAEPIQVADMAAVAGLSPSYFSQAFRRAFGQPPHAYLLTRRLERAATLLRLTDHPITDVCMEVGLTSLGSFTTSFKRMYGVTPAAYRASAPPASVHAIVPTCVARFYGRPAHRTFREDGPAG